MTSRTAAPLMSASRSTGHCRCCYQPYNIPGVSRARENRAWRADVAAGEHDHPHNYPNHGEATVHDLDMPATNHGDGAWDYDQELTGYGWYHGVVPPHARLPHMPGTVVS